MRVECYKERKWTRTTDGNNEGFLLTEFHVRKEFLTAWMNVNSREYFQFIVKI